MIPSKPKAQAQTWTHFYWTCFAQLSLEVCWAFSAASRAFAWAAWTRSTEFVRISSWSLLTRFIFVVIGTCCKTICVYMLSIKNSTCLQILPSINNSGMLSSPMASGCPWAGHVWFSYWNLLDTIEQLTIAGFMMIYEPLWKIYRCTWDHPR